MSEPYQISIEIFNSIHNGNESRISLEPWGEIFDLKPGEKIEIRFFAKDMGMPSVVTNNGWIAVYAWQGACARVIRDGQTINPQVD